MAQMVEKMEERVKHIASSEALQSGMAYFEAFSPTVNSGDAVTAVCRAAGRRKHYGYR